MWSAPRIPASGQNTLEGLCERLVVLRCWLDHSKKKTDQDIRVPIRLCLNEDPAPVAVALGGDVESVDRSLC